MSSAKRRRMRETGALPGRKPGTRATRANSLATRSIALATSSAGISRSSSRRQVASAMQKSFLQGRREEFACALVVSKQAARERPTGEKAACNSVLEYMGGNRGRQIRGGGCESRERFTL